MLKQAAEEYSKLLEAATHEMDREAEAFEVEIPDRLTGRLSRKYGLKLSKSERHERRAQYIALVFVAIFFTAIWFPQTVTAVVNVFRELVFVDNGRSMDVHSRTRADSSFSIEVPENFLSDGTFLIGNNAVRTRYQSPEEYIEITEYSEGYKLSYDNEKLDSIKDVTVNAYSGKIFRKNGILSKKYHLPVQSAAYAVQIIADRTVSFKKVRFEICQPAVAPQKKKRSRAVPSAR